jgi:hypothetical protein
MPRPLLFALLGIGAGAILLLSDCNDKKCPPNAPCPTPTPRPPTSCTNITGTRNAFWGDTCNNSGAGMVVISQAQCSFTANLTGFGTITGNISGNNLSYTIALSQPNCTGNASGTGSISGTTITGNYTVTPVTPPATGNCCMTGSFTIQFAPTPSTSVTPGITVTPTPPGM